MWQVLLPILIEFLGNALIDWLKSILDQTATTLDEKVNLGVLSEPRYLEPEEAEIMFWDEAEKRMEADFRSRKWNMIARFTTIPKQRAYFRQAKKQALNKSRIGKFAAAAWHDAPKPASLSTKEQEVLVGMSPTE